jgi:hypothetical protein
MIHERSSQRIGALLVHSRGDKDKPIRVVVRKG